MNCSVSKYAVERLGDHGLNYRQHPSLPVIIVLFSSCQEVISLSRREFVHTAVSYIQSTKTSQSDYPSSKQRRVLVSPDLANHLLKLVTRHLMLAPDGNRRRKILASHDK